MHEVSGLDEPALSQETRKTADAKKKARPTDHKGITGHPHQLGVRWCLGEKKMVSKKKTTVLLSFTDVRSRGRIRAGTRRAFAAANTGERLR